MAAPSASLMPPRVKPSPLTQRLAAIARSIHCPYCKAMPGERCRTNTGYPLYATNLGAHKDRFQHAMEVFAAEPVIWRQKKTRTSPPAEAGGRSDLASEDLVQGDEQII
jgi:hypothetical protein